MENKDKIRILAVAGQGVINAIKNICQEDHHNLTTEISPLKAEKILINETFDIILADYQMSGMNGIDLLKRIRQIYKEDSYIPILLTAAGTMNKFRKEQRLSIYTTRVSP